MTNTEVLEFGTSVPCPAVLKHPFSISSLLKAPSGRSVKATIHFEVTKPETPKPQQENHPKAPNKKRRRTKDKREEVETMVRNSKLGFTCFD